MSAKGANYWEDISGQTSWVEFNWRKEATNGPGNKDGQAGLKAELRCGGTAARVFGE